MCGAVVNVLFTCKIHYYIFICYSIIILCNSYQEIMAVNEPSPEGAGLFTSPSVIFLERRCALPLEQYSKNGRFHRYANQLAFAP